MNTLISDAAIATEVFTDDVLEKFAEDQKTALTYLTGFIASSKHVLNVYKPELSDNPDLYRKIEFYLHELQNAVNQYRDTPM